MAKPIENDLSDGALAVDGFRSGFIVDGLRQAAKSKALVDVAAADDERFGALRLFVLDGEAAAIRRSGALNARSSSPSASLVSSIILELVG